MRFDLFGDAQVGGHRQRVRQLRGERLEPLGAARGEHEASALARGQARERLADAGRRAGDDDRLAGEVHQGFRASTYTR